MKTPLLNPLALVAAILSGCALSLHAQPVITNQPASQTNLVGTTVSFSVGVNGTGPFTYQWQFNGTNLTDDIINTVVGTGPNNPTNGSYSGDGSAATNAGISQPTGVAFDISGNMYFSDSFNAYIRKVDTNGIITTVAGSRNGFMG